MLRFTLLLLPLYAAACASRSTPASAPPQLTLAITDVGVLPMDGEEVLRQQTVLIANDRIVAITGAPVAIPSGVRRINGHGQYLLPGLWDMHVHTLGDIEAFFPLFLAHGVTGVRDMGGLLDSLDHVRQRILAGHLIGPRLIAAGPLLDGPRHRWSHPIAWHIETAEQARAAVDSLAAAGVDFLKAYSTLPRDAYVALADAARDRGLPLAGHVPLAVGAEESSNLGQVSLEHAGLDVTTLPCVAHAADRMRRLLGMWTSEGYEAFLLGTAQLRGARDPDCVERLYALYRANGTWVTPTIVNAIKDSASVNWTAMALLDAERRRSCQATVVSFEQASDTIRMRYHREFLEDLARLHRARVRFLAGTDVPNPCIVPGASLHDELEWLVKAGFTPYEALRTATIHPAISLGVADSLGMLRPGRIADLVMLAANPLEDIRATREVTAVVRGGRYIVPNDLIAR